jgi:hypothetical protein
VNFQNEQRPEKGVFVIVAILVCGIISAVDGGNSAVDTVTGCVILAGSGWATWKVGRWLWIRFATQRVESMLR